MDHLGNRLHFQEEMHKLEEQALSGLDLVAKALDRVREAVSSRTSSWPRW